MKDPKPHVTAGVDLRNTVGGDEADQGSLQAGSHLYKAQKETGFCWGVNMCLYPGYLSDGRGPVVMW